MTRTNAIARPARERGRLQLLAAAVVVGLAAAPAPAAAQIVPFGKNKIQYERFDWHVLAGDHVDLYFYPEEAELAQVALREAERAYAELEVKFDYHPPDRIPLIIYSSHQHFEQTNVLPGFIPEGVAGFTEFLKGRVAIPFNGSYHDFRRVIQHELVHVFQLRKVLHERELHPRGGFPSLPQWFTEGLAEHWSGDWSPEGDLFVGDFVLNGNLPPIERLAVYNGTFAVYKLGQSVHGYLARTYGDERMILFLESLWKYESLDAAFTAVYGATLEELDARWRYDLERRYFPRVAAARPIEVAARKIVTESRANFRPTVVPRPDSLPRQFCFVSPRTGFTNVYCADLDGRDANVETVLETERSPEFESIHGFSSSLDANARGELAFVSKFGQSDALFVLDLETREVRLKRRFDDLVALSSPSWAPDGDALAFVGLSRAGFSDLYVYHRAADRLEPLTGDRFLEEAPAWSPDGSWIAYASDSVAGGDRGSRNLFARHVGTGAVRQLTSGRWRDEDPRWAPDGGRVVFTSDRSGILNLYAVDLNGAGRRLTNFTGGVLDGEPFRFRDGDGVEKDAVLFAGYEGSAFQIYRMTLPDDLAAADGAPPTAGETTGPVSAEAAAGVARPSSAAAGAAGADSSAPTWGIADTTAVPERISLPAQIPAVDWSWHSFLPDSGAAVASVPYRRRYSLDLAQGGGGLGGGTHTEAAQALFSDVLGDNLFLVQVFSTAQDGGDLLDSFGGEVTYLNLKQRLNWGATGYRLKANYSTIGTLNSPPELFRLHRYGAGGLVSYPFSKFRRMEARLNLEQNDIEGFGRSFEGGRVDREGLVSVASAAYIRDNTLWLPTGPIDGERFNVTLGGTANVSDAAAESFFGILDYRRYIRLGQESAYAVRGQFLYSDGLIPTRIVLGGSGSLRGYPRYGLRGSRYALVNQELRFPLLSGVALGGLPLLGNLIFPGVQGAVFLDVGNAWEEVEQERFGLPGVLGSYGAGLRMSLGGPLVLRLDFSRIFEIDDERDLRVFRFDRNRVDFFFGFNY
ncbi:MAG: PD40 domain-containing protein [Gemmatimonadetes bacterium]|nr:PD40 domain-containing protein [Gemmatimonadota bacterium]